MFDLRYHVASLAAVFLALVIGILVGVGIADRGLVDKANTRLLEQRVAQLRNQLDQASKRSQVSAREQKAAQSYINETYPVLVRDRLKGQPRGRARQVSAEIAAVREEWLAEWKPKLTSNTTPLSPYRVIWDLMHTVDVANTIITHDAGSPRDQLAPFWRATTPLSYIGWGKTTQLGYGLGLAMGARLARPDKLCINVWGDAAIGFTGMDFETAVRERIPILSILFNNFSMAIELKVMAVATEKYRSTDISGNYADMARAFGGYGERVTDPAEIVPAIQRGIRQTQEGCPALLEFITQKEVQTSDY